MTEARLYCRRCDDAVPYVAPWEGWRYAWWAWVGMMGVLVLAFPIMASDYCVMIPTMMGIIVAGGPLYRLRHERPTCAICSLELDRRGGGTAIRPRPPR